jgi:cbb3-type cytochrome oxidase subunit 1
MLDIATRIAILLVIAGVLLAVGFLIAYYSRRASHVEVATLSFSVLVVAMVIVVRLNHRLGIRSDSLWPLLKHLWHRAAHK